MLVLQLPVPFALFSAPPHLCFLLCFHFSPCWKLVLFSSLTLDLGAEVHYINMTALTKGHLLSSFWVVDKRHFYIGSASMDWRSLATVRSLCLPHKPPKIYLHIEIHGQKLLQQSEKMLIPFILKVTLCIQRL